MRNIYLAVALIAGLFTTAAEAANFTAKDAGSNTIIFTNPGNCTTGCTPIFSWSDSTGTNLVAVVTAGADGASNTANGGLIYGRNLLFNGTTWDRWLGTNGAGNVQGIGTAGTPAGGVMSVQGVAGGTPQPVSVASGGIVPNAYQAGAILDITGTAATTGHTCSVLGYGVDSCLGQIDDDVKAPIAAGTNTIGNTGSDPSSGKATPTMAFLAFPATTTTQIIALSGTKVTYVTMAKVFAGGSVNLTFKYGTGTNCGTGTTTLEGPYGLTAQAGWTEGNGSGPVMIVPAGNALCVTTDATVSNSGVKLIYQQF